MKPTSLRKQTARQQIVDAAKSLMWEIGYEAMSPGKVLARSGAGHGSLYHHFSGKQNLAAVALDEIEAELIESLNRSLPSAQPPLDRIRRFLSKKRAGKKGCRMGRLTHEVSVSETTLRVPIARYFAHAEKKLTESLLQAIEQGTIGAHINANELACSLLAIVQGGYVLSRAHGDNGYSSRAARGALSLLDAATLPASRLLHHKEIK